MDSPVNATEQYEEEAVPPRSPRVASHGPALLVCSSAILETDDLAAGHQRVCTTHSSTAHKTRQIFGIDRLHRGRLDPHGYARTWQGITQTDAVNSTEVHERSESKLTISANGRSTFVYRSAVILPTKVPVLTQANDVVQSAIGYAFSTKILPGAKGIKHEN